METRLAVIAKTVKEKPPKATHWSRSTIAAAMYFAFERRAQLGRGDR